MGDKKKKINMKNFDGDICQTLDYESTKQEYLGVFKGPEGEHAKPEDIDDETLLSFLSSKYNYYTFEIDE